MNEENPHHAVLPSPNLIDLPAEFKRLILAKNASKNIREHFKIRTLCRTLCDDADHVDKLFQVDLIKTHNDHQGILRLSKTFLDANNPTTVFLKVISDFMYTNERVDAFERLKHSAAVGIKPDVYYYEVIRRSISHGLDTASTIPLLSRKAICLLSRYVTEFQRLNWPINISDNLATIRDYFEQRRISTCSCTVHRYWLELLDKNIKDHGMCNSCFWSIETSLFFRIIPQTFLTWIELSGWGNNVEDACDWGENYMQEDATLVDVNVQDAVGWGGSNVQNAGEWGGANVQNAGGWGSSNVQNDILAVWGA